MKRQYVVGLDANQIKAGVNAGTRGIAYSAMYLVRSGGQSTLLAESTTAGDGDIPISGIGQAVDLAKSYIVISTLINFGVLPLDENERADEVKHLVIRYSFSGGFSGNQVYDFDTDDIVVASDNSQVAVTKAIELL